MVVPLRLSCNTSYMVSINYLTLLNNILILASSWEALYLVMKFLGVTLYPLSNIHSRMTLTSFCWDRLDSILEVQPTIHKHDESQIIGKLCNSIQHTNLKFTQSNSNHKLTHIRAQHHNLMNYLLNIKMKSIWSSRITYANLIKTH